MSTQNFGQNKVENILYCENSFYFIFFVSPDLVLFPREKFCVRKSKNHTLTLANKVQRERERKEYLFAVSSISNRLNMDHSHQNVTKHNAHIICKCS